MIMNNKRKPKFMRQEWFKKPALGIKWRSPKGNQSKLRRHIKGKGFMPSVGYGSPVLTRGMHPCGLWEVVVNNEAQLEGIDKGKNAVKIASTVGRKKREEILKRAKEMGLKVLNSSKVESRHSRKKRERHGRKEESKEQKHVTAEKAEHKHEHTTDHKAEHEKKE